MHFLNRREKCLQFSVIAYKLQSKILFTVPSSITPPWTSVVHVPLVKGLQSKTKHLFRHTSASSDLTRADSGHSCNLVL